MFFLQSDYFQTFQISALEIESDMTCHLTILGSGSSGNATYIETETTRILVDAGLSAKQLEERLLAIGRDASQLHAILITHEHSDHIQGLRVLAGRYHIPIYANKLTREAALENFAVAGGAASAKAAALSWRLFESGQRFAVGDFDVEAFSIPHDACDPVGFLIHHGDRTIGFMTDLGHTPRLVLDKARQADTLILETNHDLKMLQNDKIRPWSVKQRISGRHGHLNNEAAAAALTEIMTDRLNLLYLAHLSQDCNRPALAEKVIRSKLQELGASHVRVTVAQQDVACATELLVTGRPLTVETPSLFGRVAV